MTSFIRQGAGLVQLSEKDIRQRVQALGRAITEDYQDKNLHIIGVLNGAFIFMADLVRAIDLPLTVDFLSLSSYGSRTETSGEVRLTKDLEHSLKHRDVLIVEDIVDTGLTMQYLQKLLQTREPNSLRIASLLSKPSKRMVEVDIDYMGFEIDDAYVYGYGLDKAHSFRNLPFITSQEEHVS